MLGTNVAIKLCNSVCSNVQKCMQRKREASVSLIGGFAVLRRGTHLKGTRGNANDKFHPISTPSTLTVMRMGNGEMPVALVMSGTAVRPFSDEV